MNFVRLIYPLRLRAALNSRLLSRSSAWPSGANSRGFRLAFAPTTLPALCKTDIGHRSIAWTGFYELELSRRLAHLATAGGLLVDVGANVGYFTCLWAALNASNEVFAFEPASRNVEMLKANLMGQSFESRVRLFTCALGKEEGEMSFDPGPADQTGWGGLVVTSGANADGKVPVRRLDLALPTDAVVKVLKVDTEGADTWVLFGAERLLRERRIQHIFYERNLPRMQALGIRDGEAEAFLASVGYAVEPLKRGCDSEVHAWPRGQREKVRN